MKRHKPDPTPHLFYSQRESWLLCSPHLCNRTEKEARNRWLHTDADPLWWFPRTMAADRSRPQRQQHPKQNFLHPTSACAASPLRPRHLLYAPPWPVCRIWMCLRRKNERRRREREEREEGTRASSSAIVVLVSPTKSVRNPLLFSILIQFSCSPLLPMMVMSCLD